MKSELRTDLGLDDLAARPGGPRRHLEHLGDEIRSGISFGVGGVNRSPDAPSDHPLFADPAWQAVPGRHRGALLDKARRQLGSVGSGNHYVDLFADERDRIWVGVHYWHLMKLAGWYAYAGREWAARKAVEIIGGREVEMVHNHHNFAWEEEHFGRTFVVVRKGATPAFPGQKGFLGGSMGDDAVILEGVRGRGRRRVSCSWGWRRVIRGRGRGARERGRR